MITWIPVTPAQQRAAQALIRYRLATGRPVSQDLQGIAGARASSVRPMSTPNQGPSTPTSTPSAPNQGPSTGSTSTGTTSGTSGSAPAPGVSVEEALPENQAEANATPPEDAK